MRYLSVCSGIEAASVAWRGLRWTPVGFSEIDPFASAVLQHRFPAVHNFGDLTRHEQWTLEPGAVDLLVGGTPCQSFSVAGLRAGMADPRGNLALTFLAVADRLRPEWIIWENVPGVLSSNGGRDFGAFLGALGKLGYGFAYRVLNAQYFGVAQRRRRVFVVANATDWRRAAAVLFEPESLRGHTSQSRAKIEQTASSSQLSFTAGCFWNGEQVTQTLDAVLAKQQTMPERNRFPAVLVQSPPAQFVLDRAAFNQGANASYRPRIEASETMSAIVAKGPHAIAASEPIAFHPTQDVISSIELTHSMSAGSKAGSASIAVAQHYAVRRLTPVECERLQGFPDDWTSVPHRSKPAADGPRYKAIGNSMAVPVMRWIGERIAAVDEVTR